MFESQVVKDGTEFTLVRDNGEEKEIEFLKDITIRASSDLPASFEAPLVFAGESRVTQESLRSDGVLLDRPFAACKAARLAGCPWRTAP